MAARKKRNSRNFKPSLSQTEIEKPSIWRALNEPVVEVSEDFGRGLLSVVAIMFAVIWIAPHWGQAAAHADRTVFRSPIADVAVAEAFVAQYATLNGDVAYVGSGAQVAGATTAAAPVWFDVAQSVPGDVANAFGGASYEVLDVSGPVQQVGDFLQPGAQAVGDAWLELMMDPY